MILYSFVLILACENAENRNEIILKGDISFSNGFKVFNLDSKLSFGPEAPIGYTTIDQIDYFYFSNKPNRSIDIYHFDSPNMFKRISIHCDERCSLGEYAGSIIIDHNQILNIDRFIVSRSVLMDWEGSFLRRIMSQENEIGLENIVIASSIQIIFDGEKLFYTNWPMEYSHQKLDIKSHSPLGVYNMANSSGMSSAVKYPHGYLIESMDYFAGAPTSTTDYGDSIIVSYPQSDSICLIAKNNLKINWREIKSDYSSTPPYVEINRNGLFTEYARASLNAGLIYDNQKEVFYFLRLQPNDAEDELVFRNKYDLCVSKPIVIDILNKNFESIGSIHLKAKQYDIFKTFAHNGKLYISTNNIYNSKLNENKLVFEYFDINKVN